MSKAMAAPAAAIQFETYFNHPISEGVPLISKDKIPEPTQQHFKSDCDVNVIVKKYSQTGELPDAATRNGLFAKFGDFSETPSFTAAQQQIKAAEASFMTLDPFIRSKFDNDPGKLIAFLEDKNNYNEAVTLGFIELKSVPTDPTPPVPKT